MRDLCMSMIEKGLVARLKKANTAYRAGTPIMTDAEYDAKVEQLKKINPANPYLKTVELEVLFNDKKAVHHPKWMLSTDKAYPPKGNEKSDLQKWVDRCESKFSDLCGTGVITGDAAKELLYKITPKFDGVALRLYQNDVLATRGDGSKGSDVSHLLELGIKIHGNLGNDPWMDGELVVPTEYFNKELSDKFAHPRNVMAGLCGAQEYNKEQRDLLASGNAHMVVYKDYESLTVTAEDVVEKAATELEELANSTPYMIDGIVIEVVCEHTKSALGSTNHHHRWMVAYKENNDSIATTVNSITWQTGRTGTVSPVLEIEPVDLGGARIGRVTGHNIDYLHEHGIGRGAEIQIVRSGDVIPKHVATTKKAVVIEPTECQSCGGPLVKDGPRYRCTAYQCPAQIAGRMEYFFKTMGNCDGFGPAVCSIMTKFGFLDVGDVFDWGTSAEPQDIPNLSEGIARNLIAQLDRCQKEQVPDWRFLAAIGIEGLGTGESKKLLKHIPIYAFLNLENTALIPTMLDIEGFADISVTKIMRFRKHAKPLLAYLYEEYDFNLKTTPILDQGDELPWSDRTIVFTGKLPKPRTELTELCESLGATVGGSVSSKTTLLVYGGNLGATKKAAADKHGTDTMPADEFMAELEELL